MRNRSFLCSCATVVLVSMLLFMPQVRAEDDDRRDGHRPHVLSNAQVLAATGQSIADWGARWWQWAFEHPDVLGDTTGEFGPLGDVGGPVFFALGAGGDPVRASYKVPGDQYILLPVATYIWTFFEPCAEINCARSIVDHNAIGGITHVDVRIDGKRVSHMRAHLVKVGKHPLDIQGRRRTHSARYRLWWHSRCRARRVLADARAPVARHTRNLDVNDGA